MEKLFFKSIDYWKKNKLGKKRQIFNFLNLHDLYFFNNESLFKSSLLGKENINFIDSAVISLYFSLKNMKRVIRLSGPVFTLRFFKNKKLSRNKKHFFIGVEEKDLDKLSKKFQYLKREKLFCCNPPYIKNIKFSKKEISRIARIINAKKPDYVWICIGCPKQNILCRDLYKKINIKYFFNVGAALDFLLEKKKEAPVTVREMGLEWLYRLITDFKHSKKKVWRSFCALKYLFNLKLK